MLAIRRATTNIFKVHEAGVETQTGKMEISCSCYSKMQNPAYNRETLLKVCAKENKS
jgi:hypothetical protein